MAGSSPAINQTRDKSMPEDVEARWDDRIIEAVDGSARIVIEISGLPNAEVAAAMLARIRSSMQEDQH